MDDFEPCDPYAQYPSEDDGGYEDWERFEFEMSQLIFKECDDARAN